MKIRTKAMNYIKSKFGYSQESYSDMAKQIATRNDVVVENLDLNDKKAAVAFILAFAYRQGFRAEL